MAVFGQTGGYPVRALKQETILARGIVDIGASGAATLTTDGGILTCTKNTTGVYDVTFDPIQTQATSLAFVRAKVLKSAAPTVGNAITLAYSLSAGTWQFTTNGNAIATPVEPASGDQILLEIVASI